MDSEHALRLMETSPTHASIPASATAAASTVAVNQSLLSNATASLNLGLDVDNVRKTSRNRLSGANKIESVHESHDNVRAAVNLLGI